MARKIRLTQTNITEILETHEPGSRTRIWFEGCNGLHLSISAKGVPTYCLRYQKPSGGTGDWTLGRANMLKPEQARRVAGETLLKLKYAGVDPCDARREVRDKAKATKAKETRPGTFGALYEAYQAAPEHKHRAAGTKELQRVLAETHILPRFKDTPVADITRRDVKDCIRDVREAIQAKQGDAAQEKSGNRQANLVHSLITAVFRWGVNDDLCDVNPAGFNKIFDDRAVKRVGALNDDRIRAIWQALEADVTKPLKTALRLGCAEPRPVKRRGVANAIALQLCIATGQRPGEVCSTAREDIDRAALVWRIGANKSKTNVAYTVPLTALTLAKFDAAFALSNSQWAFPSRADQEVHIDRHVLTERFRELCARLEEEGLLPAGAMFPQLYDAKRTMRTALTQRLGVPEHVAEMCLNHAPDRSIARVYDVGDWSKEVREAHEKWTALLLSIVSPAADNPANDDADAIAAE